MESFNIDATTPNKIIDRLYLGNYIDSENLEKLLSLNIKYILVVGNSLDQNYKNVNLILIGSLLEFQV